MTVEKPVQFHVLLKSIPFKCIEQKMLKLCMKNNILQTFEAIFEMSKTTSIS